MPHSCSHGTSDVFHRAGGSEIQIVPAENALYLSIDQRITENLGIFPRTAVNSNNDALKNSRFRVLALRAAKCGGLQQTACTGQ